MASAGGAGGFSLFPNTNGTKPPSRKTTPRPRAGTAQSSDRAPSLEMTPPRHGRHTPENLSEFVIDGSPNATRDYPLRSNNPYYQSQAGPSETRPTPAPEAPPPTNTAFSGASTLVKSNSVRSRSSIAKRPIEDERASSPVAEAGLRSMFPQYNHTLPLDQQEYYPTQTSPRHIPRTVISRQSHVPQATDSRSPPVRSPVRSPMSAGSAPRWPRRQQEPPVIPPVSTSEELRDYWKAASGWKASSMEGKSFCMKLMPEKDTPIYTLTSRTQPFYHMRIDPTSASARVTMSRHDPSKPCKEKDPSASVKPQGGILGALREAEGNKPWQEAMATTLEEPSRRLPPNDGLVSLLYPSAAAKVALDKPDDIQAVMAAERECARLVWDEDSQNYFLVHPALATPFCITIERNQAWSRTEYTVEHIESPQHLAKLTRDGTGEGWMEVDTLIASRIESYYILDVAVCALMLVANIDEKNVLVEQFEPPPAAHLRAPSAASADFRRSSSRISSRILQGKRETGKTKTKRSRMEEFELDLESQASSLGGKLDIKDKDREKLPGTARTAIKLLSFAFKCVIWALTLIFKALMKLVVGLTKCLTSEKL